MIHKKISFAGAGRVAGALCRELYHKGAIIDLIVSESEKNGRSLAESCKSLWSSGLNYPDSTDIIIVAVPDHRLQSVLSQLKCNSETIVVHTAGSIGMDVFPGSILRRGVFYPLQTFSYGRKVDFTDLPVLIETTDNQASELLKLLAESLRCKVLFSDTEHRRMLHLSAVFVSNFTNHMLTEGKNIALRAGFPFEILIPLINETISKALDIGPEISQTGPAVRNDNNTIEKHLELLSFSPELQRIYNEITLSIMHYHNKL
jgi:predicted short-subunit dehydrogenase-like oxidoreductase (DUF2520 family)